MMSPRRGTSFCVVASVVRHYLRDTGGGATPSPRRRHRSPSPRLALRPKRQPGSARAPDSAPPSARRGATPRGRTEEVQEADSVQVHCPGGAEALGCSGQVGWQRSSSTVARRQIPTMRRLQKLRVLHRKPRRSPQSHRSPRTTIASACSAGSRGSRNRARNSCIVRWAAARDGA